MKQIIFISGLFFLFSQITFGQCLVSENKQIFPSDFRSDYVGFGSGIATDEDLLIIGAPFKDTSQGNDSGSAYIYRFDGTSWVQEAQLFSPSLIEPAQDHFGSAVSIHGNVAVVAAANQGTTQLHPGAVYVYRFDGSNWMLEEEIFPPKVTGTDSFGFSIAVRGDTILIGAPSTEKDGEEKVGAAYIYRYDGLHWNLQKSLTIPAATPDRSLELYIYFGYQVALTDERAFVSAPGGILTNNPSGAGFVSIFHDNGSDWEEEQNLINPVAISGAAFGLAMAADQNHVIVGKTVPYYPSTPGTAYVFGFNGTSWENEATLTMSPQQSETGCGFSSNDFYAATVAIHGDWVAVGAPIVIASAKGPIFLYEKQGTGWVSRGWLINNEGAPKLGGLTVLGKHGLFVPGKGISSVHAISIPEDLCPAGDLNGDSTVDGADLALLLADWGTASSCSSFPNFSSDMNGDGVIDGADLGQLLAAWK